MMQKEQENSPVGKQGQVTHVKNKLKVSPWFYVAGDLDDFIFYGENEPKMSER